MKTVLKYSGAKWSIAHWIIGHFPPHHSYLEPFFGSGGVFFRKPRSNIETVNDIDGEVVNLFRCIRENECAPAVEVIARFNNPGVLIYCDPPYLLSTRRGKQYRHEMTDADHMELLDVLKKHSGPALISGYPSELYEKELSGWRQATTTTTDQLSQVKREVLWMNFDPSEQITLF